MSKIWCSSWEFSIAEKEKDVLLTWLHDLHIHGRVIYDKKIKTNDLLWSMVKWKCPKNGFIKTNFDGASKGNPWKVGGDGVFRNSECKILFTYSESYGTSTKNYVEDMALLTRIKITTEKNGHVFQLRGTHKLSSMILTKMYVKTR